MEQYYRDNRLNPIHEGTHGIQSLDLLGRKVSMNGGAALKQLLKLINDCCQRASEHESLTALRQPLEQLLARLQAVTLALLDVYKRQQGRRAGVRQGDDAQGQGRTAGDCCSRYRRRRHPADPGRGLQQVR